MNTNHLFKGLATAGTALALSFGVSSASAVPVFEVTPSVVGGPASPFQANTLSGTASTLLTLDPTTNTVQGSGYIAMTAFNLDSVPLSPNVTGLNTAYDLYTTFSYTTSLTSGTFGEPGSTYDVTSLTYNLWAADPAGSTTFTPANADGTPATAVNGAAQLVGTGTLIEGTAGFNALGGASFNSTNTYVNTAFGSTFFTAPVPFFDISFDEFNNTTQGFTRNGNFIALNSAAGTIDFNRTSVPEPATLALVGIAMLGIGASTRKRKH